MSEPAAGPVGQVDATLVPRYAGLTTFARLPRREDEHGHDVAVLGVPFDAGVTYRPGARFGPNAIREASRLLKPYNPRRTRRRSRWRRWSTPATSPPTPSTSPPHSRRSRPGCAT